MRGGGGGGGGGVSDFFLQGIQISTQFFSWVGGDGRGSVARG